MKHAPRSTGYAFAAKDEYRRKLWLWVDANIRPQRPVRKRVVAYLDTRDGLETRFLLSLGYRPEHLHAINSNPADMALLTMRLRADGLPQVQTHGIDFARVVESEKIRFDVMSFDGCGHIASPNTLRCVRKMSAVARPGCVITATVLAGRESGFVARAIERAGDEAHPSLGRKSHLRRLLWLEHVIVSEWDTGVNDFARRRWSVGARKRARYISSSNQAMLWLAVRVIPRQTTMMAASESYVGRTGRKIFHVDGEDFEAWVDNPLGLKTA